MLADHKNIDILLTKTRKSDNSCSPHKKTYRNFKMDISELSKQMTTDTYNYLLQILESVLQFSTLFVKYPK